ncbi:YceD family protein [Desulfofundulus sp.]|uniref:YceD family protein n=1 Tax=Desulfofundulus sp. TaxID=2282750 RepID=UPI003C78DCD4
MRIDVSDLKKSPGESIQVELSSPLPEFEFNGEKLIFNGPVRASLEVTNTGKALLVEGEVRGVLEVRCARCLEPFRWPVETTLNEVYYPADNEEAAVVDPAEEEYQEWIPFTGDVLDVTPEVLKSIMLALPMRFLCDENCRGLCPRCGRNLNVAECSCPGEDVDPRLMVLKDMFKDVNR